MNTWGKQIRRAWGALSVADLGETSDPGEMTRRLTTPEGVLPPVLHAPPPPRRLIVLAVKGQVLAPALDYVRDAAARLEADVAVLEAASAPALPAAVSGANGVVLQEHRLAGDFEAGLRQFLRRHPQAIFVVIGDASVPGELFPRLPVPVVVVTEIVRTSPGRAS